MINIVGLVMAILTFPGVIVHEISHRLFCDLSKTPVFEVKYVGISKPPLGYVVHKPSYGLWNNVLISLGPFIFNNFVAIFLGIPYGVISGMGAGGIFETSDIFLIVFLLWLSFSCAYNSFPSSVDVESLTEYVNGYHGIFTQILYFPFRLIFFIQRILSIFLFNALWALGISIGQSYLWYYMLKPF